MVLILSLSQKTMIFSVLREETEVVVCLLVCCVSPDGSYLFLLSPYNWKLPWWLMVKNLPAVPEAWV